MVDDERGWLARRLERWTRSGGWADSALIRLLVHETWFRLAFFGILAVLVFLGLFLPKIWNNAPRGFHTDLPVSGLDHLQAWSLKRTALKAMAAGRAEEAMQAWRGALMNTPGNPELSRGLLRFLLSTERNKTFLGHAYSRSKWLLELTQTNRADVDLVARVYEKYQLYDPLLILLQPYEKELSPALELACLKALFRTGRVEAFAQRLARVDRARVQDPELPLYEAAYQAGWGATSQRAAARGKLVAALDDVGLRYLAARLLLVVARQDEDLPSFEQALERLYDWRADTSADHVSHWRFLVSLHRQADAIARAKKNFGYPPASAGDAIELARGYIELGLNDLARPMLQRFAPEFGFTETIWEIYASLLTQEKRWEDLLQVALRIREQPMVSDTLSTYSYYLEGMAMASLKRFPQAEAAFERLARYRVTNGPVAMSFATQVARAGYAEPARQLLLQHQNDPDAQGRPLQATPLYWHLMLQLTYQLKLEDQMLEAATRCVALQPNNRVAQNNYAATLIALRQKPFEALRTTLDLWRVEPGTAESATGTNSLTSTNLALAAAETGRSDTGLRLNRSLALLLNGRTSDARELLLGIDPAKLRANEAQAFYLAWFEIGVNLQQWETARGYAAKLNTNTMLPTQLKWFTEQVRRFPPLPKPAA